MGNGVSIKVVVSSLIIREVSRLPNTSDRIVVQTAFKIGKNGVAAGTNLVPEIVPRPVARLSVAIVATILSLLVFKSFLSTVFFSLGVMGFVYFVYLALNKDK